jgi:hypothetical protein
MDKIEVFTNALIRTMRDRYLIAPMGTYGTMKKFQFSNPTRGKKPTIVQIRYFDATNAKIEINFPERRDVSIVYSPEALEMAFFPFTLKQASDLIDFII